MRVYLYFGHYLNDDITLTPFTHCVPGGTGTQYLYPFLSHITAKSKGKNVQQKKAMRADDINDETMRYGVSGTVPTRVIE